ncbi:DUF4292 domain-containing protein [Flagellimonas allohymeniacidonis]|uniref:DUF4292 domain-containing protein n=2 Tax=Flagellimonas allohymeniacidonis TaxID=2517819 RepID=A0A4Q8QHR9_9FLAO|nr:DUF4292 domain-containing protein [Allomuricauda hymeniacidonis]
MKGIEIKQLVYFGLVALLLSSCKSTKAIASGEVDLGISTKKIISNHYENQTDFKTLRGKVKIDYFNGKENQAVSVSLRMQKDRVIWMSAPLGVVKAHITPERVSFYNKLQGEYFDGDFGYLSQLLGTELDFKIVQNLLLGNALRDLREDRYVSSVSDGNYELKPKRTKEFFKLLFQLEPKNFKIATQEIIQPEKEIVLSADYTYQDVSGKVLPNEVRILAIDQDDKTTIDLNFRNLELNKSLNFPYKIPKGYDEIILK